MIAAGNMRKFLLKTMLRYNLWRFRKVVIRSEFDGKEKLIADIDFVLLHLRGEIEQQARVIYALGRIGDYVNK